MDLVRECRIERKSGLIGGVGRHFASSQFWPGPDVHGQAHLQLRRAFHDFPDEARDCLDLLVRRLEDQLVVDLEDQPRGEAGLRQSAASSRIMAILMMSAAVPWKGAFRAMRSALARTAPLEAAISGIGRTRPKSVVTSRVLRASARTPSRHPRTLGNWAK